MAWAGRKRVLYPREIHMVRKQSLNPDDKMKYSTVSNSDSSQKELQALRKYVSEINKIVDAGPKGGLRAFADGRPVSERKVGATFIAMSKEGALAARASKALRGTQKKAK